MTSKTIGALRAKVSAIAADLHEAKANAELYARLQTAASEAKRLNVEYGDAMSVLRKAEIDDEATRADERFKGLSDLEIAEVPDKDGGGLLRSIWRISYTVNAFNGYSTKAATVTKNGFEELDQHVMAYLLQKHPERIPAKIMALAPDEPGKAISKLLYAKRRGYLSEKAA